MLPGQDLLNQGVAVGDVTSASALLWFRTSGPAKALVKWTDGEERSLRSTLVQTTFEHDYTAKVLLEDLQPGRRYDYSVLTGPPGAPEDALRAPEGADGSFQTPPANDERAPVTFVWSGDLGGQQRCRPAGRSYEIFDRIREVAPAFMIFLGDTIYADERCSAPPNEPGSDFQASTLEEYRSKHRYQREDASLRRLLQGIPIYVIWDDHEVRNNFSGPLDPQMPIGRQALLDYWPIRTPPHDPGRLYRRIRWGRHLELFILDTRQYRSSNAHPDGPNKTMLGSRQRAWLLDGLRESTATWKIVVTSVPLSNPKGGTLLMPGNDSWARGADGTGFLTELQGIVGAARGVRNIVWLAGDVHYTQVNVYDPDGDGQTDFHEFIAGPLSARQGRPVPPNPDLKPATLYSEGGFDNFGAVTVDGETLRVSIRDGDGHVRYEQTFESRHGAD
ncbi:alkaline phosphatase D family protein [Candidatus Nitrospira bockiana]